MRRYHNFISIKQSPAIWFNDKFFTINNNKKAYIGSFMPAILAFLAIIADVTTIWKIDKSVTFHIIFALFFVYGLINLYFITMLQRTKLRLSRLHQQFEFFHIELIHGIRDYQRKMKMTTKPNEIKEEDIIREIEKFMEAFNKQYMYEHHRRDTNITIKYSYQNLLRTIRVGTNINNRKTKPESIQNSTIFNTLFKGDNRHSYLYIKNIKDPDKKETKMLGQNSDVLISRAINKYNTIIAIPLKISNTGTYHNDLKIANNIGYVSFDHDDAYGFGNLYEHELNIICSFVDVLSIMVCDLIQLKIKENESKSK